MPTTPKLALPYPVAADPADVPTDMGELATRIDAVTGAANGLAPLGADGKVPAAHLPAIPAAPDLTGYQTRAEEGQPNGYASLDAGGKVPASQLPAAAPGPIISSALGGGQHRLQAGTHSGFTDANGQMYVPFPVAFSNATVFVTATRKTGGSQPHPIIVSSNQAGFTYGWQGAGNADGTVIDWMAVGLA